MAMFTRPRGLRGCCSGGSALAQLEPGVSVAVTTPEIGDGARPPSLSSLFAVSVGAGLTVWLVTKLLGKGR